MLTCSVQFHCTEQPQTSSSLFPLPALLAPPFHQLPPIESISFGLAAEPHGLHLLKLTEGFSSPRAPSLLVLIDNSGSKWLSVPRQSQRDQDVRGREELQSATELDRMRVRVSKRGNEVGY